MPPPARFGVFHATIDGAPLLLDVDNDRYRIARPPHPIPTSPLPRLMTAAHLTGPKETIWPNGTPSPRPCFAALTCLLRISRALQQGRLANLISTLLAISRPDRPRSDLAVEDLIASFCAVRPLYPAQAICRLDAPALCALLWAYGRPARLVFGARLEPFSAHCWVEIGAAVVNEDREDVLQYAPIMAVSA
jgi:hypothetical protein